MEKKTRFRAGLYFGIVMSIFFIGFDFIQSDQTSNKEIIRIIISGLVAGAVAGFLFGWSIGWFANSKAVANSTKIELDTDETVAFETGANHFKGMEGVGGKLYLTNKRLVFKSHKFNIQKHTLSINLDEIINVERIKTAGIINNGLRVTHQDKQEKFVVEKAGGWVSLLQSKKGVIEKS